MNLHLKVLLLTSFALIGGIESGRFIFEKVLKDHREHKVRLFVIGEDTDGSVQTVLENLGTWELATWKSVTQYHESRMRHWDVDGSTDMEKVMFDLKSFVPSDDQYECLCVDLLTRLGPEVSDMAFEDNIIVSLAPDPCRHRIPESCERQLPQIKTTRIMLTKGPDGDGLRWLQEGLLVPAETGNAFLDFPYVSYPLNTDEEMKTLKENWKEVAQHFVVWPVTQPDWDAACYAPVPDRSRCVGGNDKICTSFRSVPNVTTNIECQSMGRACRTCFLNGAGTFRNEFSSSTITIYQRISSSTETSVYDETGSSPLRFSVEGYTQEQLRQKVAHAELFVIGEAREGIVQTVLENYGLWYQLTFDSVVQFHENVSTRKSASPRNLEKIVFELHANQPTPRSQSWKCFCRAIMSYAKEAFELTSLARKILVIVSLSSYSCTSDQFSLCTKEWSEIRGARILMTASSEGDPIKWLQGDGSQYNGDPSGKNYVIRFPFRLAIEEWDEFQSERRNLSDTVATLSHLEGVFVGEPVDCYAKDPSYSECARIGGKICEELTKVPGSKSDRNCTAEDGYCRTCFRRNPYAPIEMETNRNAAKDSAQTDKTTVSLTTAAQEIVSFPLWAIGLIIGAILFNAFMAVVFCLLVGKIKKKKKRKKEKKEKVKKVEKPNRDKVPTPILLSDNDLDGIVSDATQAEATNPYHVSGLAEAETSKNESGREPVEGEIQNGVAGERDPK